MKVETPISNKVKVSTFFAAVSVADMAQQHRTDRPCHITDAEGGESRYGSRNRVERRKKYLAEHQRCRGAVNKKIVILDRAADPAGQRCLARRTGGALRCGVGRAGCARSRNLF